LVISGIVGERIWNERIEFWEKVYGEAHRSVVGAADIPGFDMTTMSSVYFDEGLVEVVGAGEVVTSECILRVRTTRSSWAETSGHRLACRHAQVTGLSHDILPRRGEYGDSDHPRVPHSFRHVLLPYKGHFEPR
jgi:hypothetical protein